MKKCCEIQGILGRDLDPFECNMGSDPTDPEPLKLKFLNKFNVMPTSNFLFDVKT